MKKKFFIFFIFFLFFQRSSVANIRNNLSQTYECQGNFKTMLFNLPTNFKIKDDSLTLKYTGDVELLKDLEEKYKYNLLHSNGVYVEKISSNRISFKAIGVDGTFLLDECKLHFPIENQISKKLIELLPTLLYIYSNNMG